MPLNKACVGKEYAPITVGVTLDAMQKYARACNDGNPCFFDDNVHGGITAPPMFGVTVIWQSVIGAVGDPEVQVDLLRLLHGEQDMEFHAPIRPGDQISTTARIDSIETRSTGETLVVKLYSVNHRGEPVQTAVFGVFIRGGGKRISSSQQRVVQPERGEPLAAVKETIDKDQTSRYADASGDHNPIHVDERVARMAGLPGIIVHGLCTMAFASKAAIAELCGADPVRLKRLYARFARPVFPGQTITTLIWHSGERAGRKIFRYETRNPEGQAVIQDGAIETIA